MNYVEEIKKFESSPLFDKCYNRFISFLKMSKHYFTSKQLEAVLGVSGVQIRKLAQHARRKGVIICSDHRGYCYACSHKDAQHTLDHLKKRAKSLQVTIDVMENSNHYNSLAKRK